MSQTLSTILAAAEHAAGATSEEHGAGKEHKSETPFFVAGGILVAFAIAISVFGFKKPDFPGTAAAARGIMALSATLVAATLFSAIYVAL